VEGEREGNREREVGGRARERMYGKRVRVRESGMNGEKQKSLGEGGG